MSRAVGLRLPLATRAVYLWLVLSPGLRRQDRAGGLAPPDLRPLGDDLNAARAAWVRRGR
jgi:hypothetical protein